MIQETKCSSETLDKIASKCWQGCQSVIIDVEGDFAEDLEILWNPSDIILNHFFSTRRSISSNFQAIGSTQVGVITNSTALRLSLTKNPF
jgi:hypothetical protein